MEQIAQFTVVRGQTDTLITKVNELIAQGWQPWGGFQDAGREADGFTFYGQQAMVKYGHAPAAALSEEAAAAEVPADEVLPAEADVLDQLRSA